MKNIPLMSSVIFFLIGFAIIVVEVINELQGGWLLSEMIVSSLLNIIFVAVLAGFLYRYLKNKNKLLKYVMSIALVLALAFLFNISLSDGQDFPNLAAMNIVGVGFIIPGLLIVRGIVTLINIVVKYFLRHSRSS